ncbi:hypothetical protein [Lactococcus fujiensis]|nr:hypothetical protein [Lactococcus fujiensis]
MEILYTDITQDLTASLLEIAEQEVAKKEESLLYCSFFDVF